MAVRTIKGILQRRHTEKGEPNHSLTGEGHGRGEESGSATSIDSTAYGERNVIKVGTETIEISGGSVAHNYREPSYKPQGEVQGRRPRRSRMRSHIYGWSRQHNSTGGEDLYFYRAQRGGK